MLSTLREFAARNGRVWVLRREGGGVLRTAEDLRPPLGYDRFFKDLAGEANISSTALDQLRLRREAQGQAVH